MLNVMASSRASPLPHLELRAPTQSTVNRNRAQKQLQRSPCVRYRSPTEKTRKPRNTGLSAFQHNFAFQLVKNWHAPCNIPFK